MVFINKIITVDPIKINGNFLSLMLHLDLGHFITQLLASLEGNTKRKINRPTCYRNTRYALVRRPSALNNFRGVGGLAHEDKQQKSNSFADTLES